VTFHGKAGLGQQVPPDRYQVQVVCGHRVSVLGEPLDHGVQLLLGQAHNLEKYQRRMPLLEVLLWGLCFRFRFHTTPRVTSNQPRFLFAFKGVKDISAISG